MIIGIISCVTGMVLGMMCTCLCVVSGRENK